MATVKGIDCAYPLSVATAKAVKDAGYTFVARYLVPQQYGWKRMVKAEADAISTAGLNIVSVFESAAARAKGGESAGKADGTSALIETSIVGQSKGTAVYFAVDFDAQTSDLDEIEAYLRGAASVLKTDYNVGVYGEFDVVEEMMKRGAAKHGWITYAWSGGKKPVHANIYQYHNGQNVVGINADLDESYGYEGWWNTAKVADPVVIESPKPALPFKDVPTTHWAYGAIKQAKELGIISGYPDGTFQPDNTVTRAEMTAIAIGVINYIKGDGK